MASNSALGDKKKKYSRGNGLKSDRATTRYHERGLTRDDEHYKDPSEAEVSGLQIGAAPTTVSMIQDDFLSSLINGPVELGNELGAVITGEADMSSIDNSLLLPSLVNVGLTGYIVNVMSGYQPSSANGYMISLGGQLVFGIIFRK